MGTRTGSKHPGLYKRGTYWWLTRDPVTARAQSTRCTSLKAALAVQAERERLAADPAYAASQGARLSEQCGRFIAMKTSANRSTATMGYYRDKLGHWLRIFGDVSLSTFDVHAFDRFVAQRRQEEATDHTISKEVRVFSQVLKMAKRAGDYSGELTILKPHDLSAKYVPRTRAMTLAEVERLWPELDVRLGALLDVSVALGIRLSEATKLAPADVDLKTGLVKVRGTKTPGAFRTIPILSPLRGLLERALPMLPIGRGNNLYRSLEVACRRAGVVYATPNDWRRSNATILAELGVNADLLRRLLGHTSRQMVDRVYSQPSPEAIGRLAEQAIAERSSGVVEPADYGENSPGPTSAKCAEGLASDTTAEYSCGFLSRRSHVQIVSEAPLPRVLPRPVSQERSELALPVLALAYAGLVTGVLPANDTERTGRVA